MLYLRASADVSGRLTWSGKAHLLTDQHETLLVQAALRPTRLAGRVEVRKFHGGGWIIEQPQMVQGA